MKDITVIIGPTAVGKSNYAIRLAHKIDAEIISADAYQIYKGLNIGTAKVPISERQGITHHLIDIKSPFESYNVNNFTQNTTQIISEIRSRNKSIIICGGTGLYIKAFLYRYEFPNKPHTQKVELTSLTPDEQWAQLHQVDPETAIKIPAKNNRRVARALEIYHETGLKPSAARHQTTSMRTDVQLIGLNLESRNTLIHKINTRVDTMIHAGLIAEVESLLNQGVPHTTQSLQAIGYKEIVRYLLGHDKKDNAIEQIKIKTRQFAKRQMTWFNALPDVEWKQT